MQADCGQAALLYSHLSFNSPPTGPTRGSLLLFEQLPPPSSSERLYTCRTLRDQLLAQLPQTGGAPLVLVLGLGRGQAAEAVVEVHASQSLQLRSQRAVHRGGRPLLLWTHGEREELSGEGSARRRDTRRDGKRTEKKPKLYIHSIYIHIFIYLSISLPSVYSCGDVGSDKRNKPTAKGRRRV